MPAALLKIALRPSTFCFSLLLWFLVTSLVFGTDGLSLLAFLHLHRTLDVCTRTAFDGDPPNFLRLCTEAAGKEEDCEKGKRTAIYVHGWMDGWMWRSY